MTYDQYWNDDCRLTEYYRKAHELQNKRRNQELWLQGAYIYEALLDVAPVLQFRKKNAKPTPYPEEPFPLTEKEVQEKKEREARKRYEKIKARMEAFTKVQNKRKTEQEVTDDG